MGHPQSANLLFDLWLSSRAATALLDDALRPAGLTADEFAVFSVLAAGSPTPGELAAWMSAPLTTVSSYVRRFQARGAVRRVPNPQDGRSYRLELTDEGRRAHEHAAALFLPVLEGVEAGLGSSVTRTRSALGGVLDVLRVAQVARG